MTSTNSERLEKASGLSRHLLALLVGLLASLALIVSGAGPAAARNVVGPQPVMSILSFGPQTAAAQTCIGADGLRLRPIVSATGVAADTGANVGRDAAESCLNSFTGDTPVTMADGRSEPIKDVKVGDKVLATDPQTGKTAAEPVVQLIRHSGKHTMVGITLADGSVLDSTDGHPIWDATTRQFTDASNLHVGDKIETDNGAMIAITGLTSYQADLTAYNLQIGDIHTYYAGTTPVLVHNSCTPNPFRGTNMSDKDSLAYHYATHGNGRTIEQYAQDAQSFADNPTGTTSSVLLKDGTTGTSYRTRGGPGGILDSNGNVVTFWYK